jgi:hypothetical protein
VEQKQEFALQSVAKLSVAALAMLESRAELPVREETIRKVTTLEGQRQVRFSATNLLQIPNNVSGRIQFYQTLGKNEGGWL